MNSAVAWFGIIGSVANIAMAVAAFVALTLWRKQIAGASQHELAKKLAGALRKAAIARREVVSALRGLHIEGEGLNAFLGRALAPDTLRRSGGALSDAVEELESLEGQVAVQWGDTVLGLVAVIRQESKGLAILAGLELSPTYKDSVRGYLASASPPGVAPSFTGAAFEKVLDMYTHLAQQWLGVYVGRDGARAINAEVLEARRKQVDEEVARVAEPERLALDREAAARDAHIAQLGGPEAVARLVLEQIAAARSTDG